MTTSTVTAHTANSDRLRSAAGIATTRARRSPAGSWEGSGGRAVRRATALTAAATPTATVAARHPITCPRAVARGVPRTSARELPVKTTAVARPARPGATSLAATGASTDQNTPCANAHTTRAPAAARLVAPG